LNAESTRIPPVDRISCREHHRIDPATEAYRVLTQEPPRGWFVPPVPHVVQVQLRPHPEGAFPPGPVRIWRRQGPAGPRIVPPVVIRVHPAHPLRLVRQRDHVAQPVGMPIQPLIVDHHRVQVVEPGDNEGVARHAPTARFTVAVPSSLRQQVVPLPEERGLHHPVHPLHHEPPPRIVEILDPGRPGVQGVELPLGGPEELRPGPTPPAAPAGHVPIQVGNVGTAAELGDAIPRSIPAALVQPVPHRVKAVHRGRPRHRVLSPRLRWY